MEFEKKDNKIIIKDQSNNKKEYEVIALETIGEKKFLIYTDEKTFENGSVALYINSIIEENGKVILKDVSENESNIIINKLRERIME